MTASNGKLLRHHPRGLGDDCRELRDLLKRHLCLRARDLEASVARDLVNTGGAVAASTGAWFDGRLLLVDSRRRAHRDARHARRHAVGEDADLPVPVRLSR